MANRNDIHILKVAYRNMIMRCYEPLTPNYFRYGGRGIFVDQEWAVHNDGLDAFIVWSLNHGYAPGLTIDRIDNNGPYAPWNCRWVSMKVQGNNRRTNTIIVHFGEAHTMTEWVELINQPTLTRNKVSDRVGRGWPYEAALFVGDYQDPDDGPVYDFYGNVVEIEPGPWLVKHKNHIARIKQQRKNGLGHVNKNEFFGFDENGQYRSESVLPLKDGDLRDTNHKSTYTYRRPKKPKPEKVKPTVDEAEIIEHELYDIWQSVIFRCYNRNSAKYQYYGRKGVEVCALWRNNFEAFKEWALPLYTSGDTILLLDCRGPYAPWNCFFTPREDAEPAIVTRAMRVKYRGKIVTVSDLARNVATVDYATLKYRIEAGHSITYSLFAKLGDPPRSTLRNRDGFMVLNYRPGTDSSDLGKDFYLRMMKNKNK